VFRQLINSLDGTEDFTSVRLVELGGEPVTRADFELYKSHLPASCMFANVLGTNETGVLRIYVADKTTQFSGATVPLGDEVEDKEVLILDDEGSPTKPGDPGRVVVRSQFLSPGYWRRPELTAAAFRPDPADEQKRIYYTGDLGTLLPDGCLIYKGRKDFRVKIRGIGVEVEEVDAALRLHPSIQASVVTHEDSDGHPRLVAYVVRKRAARITVSELRTFLSQNLPGHMIPARFVFLEALPLLPNGKLDRRALPRPDQARPLLDGVLIAPRDKIERRLTKLCESLLGISPIGVCDDLFDIGIDSLRILRLVAQIEASFAVQLAPALLFQSPTIAQLAAILRKETSAEPSSTLVPIQTTGTKPPFFWIHGDFSTVPLSRYLGSEQPFYALDHQGQDGRAALYKDVETIASHYLAQMRRVQSTGPYFMGGYSFGGVVALEISQQIARQGGQVGLLVLLDPPSLVRRGSESSGSATFSSESPRMSIAVGFRHHIANLAGLTLKSRLVYIRPRTLRKAVEVLGVPALDRAARTAIYQAFLALRYRLPVFVRSRYVLDIYSRALDRYRPQACSARSILFTGQNRQYYSQSDWREVLIGDRKEHVVNASHEQIREAPYVHLWAETLKNALSNAQLEMPLVSSTSPGATT
jgi:thioesterase domain-containing protein/acyl carrier protein